MKMDKVDDKVADMVLDMDMVDMDPDLFDPPT